VGQLEERFIIEDQASIGCAAQAIEGEDCVIRLRDDAGDLGRRQHRTAQHRCFRILLLD
jgi:hypothetical protein